MKMKWNFDSSHGEKMFSLEECTRRISERNDFLSRLTNEEKEYVLGLETRLRVAQTNFSESIGKKINAKHNLRMLEKGIAEHANVSDEMTNEEMKIILKNISNIIKKEIDNL